MNRRRIAVYVSAGLVPLAIGTALAGWDIWRESATHVKTKDAQVTASVVGAQTTVAGKLGQYLVGVGDVVSPGDVVASLSAGAAPVATGAGAAASVAAPNRFTVNVRAPVAGTVISEPATAGSSVTAGQTLLTIGDLDGIWIVANVDESRVGHLRTGLSADVYVPALDRTFPGQVTEITPATSSVTVATTQARGATTTARTIQTVPVRIDLDRSRLAGVTLYPGMSAEVTIAVR